MFNQALGELMAKVDRALSLTAKFDGNPTLLGFAEEIQLKVSMIFGAMKIKVESQAQEKK